MASGSSATASMTVDELVQRIQRAQPAEFDKHILPTLRKLDKEAAVSSRGQRGAGGRSAGPGPPTQANAAAAAGQAASTRTAQGGATGSNTAGPSQVTPSGHLLEQRLKDGSDPLTALDPTLHAIAYLFFLNARLRAYAPDWNGLRPYVQAWCDRCDIDAVRDCPEQVLAFANLLHRLGDATNQPALPLQPLNSLLARYPLPGYLTALHPLFLRVVMDSQLYPAAIEVLQRDITDVDKHLFPVRYQDHLLYHYLGGTILALMGDYSRAADLLETCVSAPGSHASMMQVDAHKKLLLVQLLAHGKTLPLPRYVSQAVVTATKTLSAPYSEFATAYRSLSKARVSEALDKGRDAFSRDLNWGLATLCAESLRRRQIMSLTETFVTLTLGQVCSHVGMPEASDANLKEVEEEIVEMIARRQIYATLTPPEPATSRAATIVTFSDDPEPYLSHETVSRVTTAIKNAQELEKRWHGEANRLEASKEFVQKAWSTAAAGPAGALGGAGGAGYSGFSNVPGYSDDFDYGSYSPAAGLGGTSWVDAGDDAEMGSD
ncbi:hypothetical protein BMF94_2248 [Rhodotorula taiwanensis]|uniref:COP9 signalosome complex subunit 3 n=1 Tax=Rhodotorula taiwanensis TaxID=741276 RepID=A0A2S5BDB9_9BASI|nr:hypothetical protein BMF94_2248 [Rhodotorula taiwanensis]